MAHIDDETLALHALGEDVLEPGQRLHLAECTECTRSLQGLVRVVAGARSADDEPALVAPSPRVWSRVHTELGLSDVPAVVGPVPAGRADDGGAARADDDGTTPRADVVELAPARSRRAWVPVLVAACVALVLGIAAGTLWERRSGEPAETTIASAVLEPLPDWPEASGTAQVQEAPDGRRQIVVTVDAPVPEGTYREVWLLRPDVSGLVSLGVLEGNEGRFEVPEGLDLAAYPVVDISEEHFDGDPTHSGDSVVRGPLDV